MNKFNLTFRGEIESDKRPEEVQQRFAELFGIDDSERVARFFSGETIVMRRHLERKEAARWFRDLRSIGAYGELVKVSSEELEAHEAAEAAAAQEQKKQQQQAAAATKKQAQQKKRDDKRKAAARTARDKAARAEKKRLASEAAARQKAAQEQQRKDALKQKREAERKATLARQAEEKRLAEEEDARKKAKEAELAELKAAAAAQAAQLEAERKAEREAERKAQQTAQAQAEQTRKAAEEAAREQILDELQQRKSTEEALRQQKALEEQAITRGASELARGVKPAAQQATTRTRVDLPVRHKQQGKKQQSSTPRKRQPGEPNLYKLSAFRVSQHVRERGARAISRRRNTVFLATLALLLLAAGTIYYRSLPPLTPVTGVHAVAADASGQLYILAGDTLFRHDRAGLGQDAIKLAELGLEQLWPPLHFLEDGTLLGLGVLPGGSDDNREHASLLQCDLKALNCRPFADELNGRSLANFYPHPIDGSIFVLESNQGELLRLDSNGGIINRAALAFPANPAMQPDSGLLLLNSKSGAAISVYRYDNNAFGQQLDEILLVTPTTPAPQTVIDFLRTGPTWWALMNHGANSPQALYAFDENWGYKSTAETHVAAAPFALTRWGDKLLLHSNTSIDILRFNARGDAEAPLSSELLIDSVNSYERDARWRFLGSRIGFSALVLIILLAAGWAYLNHLRALVYNSQRPGGAQPADDLADQLNWIPPAANRTSSLRLRSIACTVLAIALCLVAIGMGASMRQLAALLCLLAGVAFFLLLLQRSAFGHIAVLGEQLLLVDHGDMYHIGRGSDIHYRGNFIMIADVVVYGGSLLWPTFDREKVRERVVPLAAGGVRIDRKTLWVKLAERGHPLLQGIAGLIVCSILALLIISA